MQWRASNVVGEARSMDLAKLGDRQLERATDVLKGLLVYEQFNKASTPAPAPAAPATPATKAPTKGAAPVEAPKPNAIRELTKPGVN
jgi:carboxyl-terminal processing protease